MNAQKKQNLPDSKVDYTSFMDLSEEAQQYRAERLIPVDTFIRYAKEEHTIVLDTRSEAAYQRKHIKGAIHLNFSDFTTEKLAKVIPEKTTRILIYCNNNIEDDPIAFPTKMMPLALNIPTFINLYGYGYKNIYELASLISVKNPIGNFPTDTTNLEFEGTDILYNIDAE